MKKRSAKNIKKYGLENCVLCACCGFVGRKLHTHIKQHNLTKEQYLEKYPNNKLISDHFATELSNRMLGEANPGYNHGGRLSPLSEKYIYAELVNRSELIQRISDTKNKNDSVTTRLSYYLKKGLSEEEAKEALAQRQTTFSLEKCVQKYGAKGGRKRWLERQNKWISNYKKQNYSKISQDLFWKIFELHPDRLNLSFATLHPETFTNDDSGNNWEAIANHDEAIFKLDFVHHPSKKVIEFDGEYWHASTQEKDLERQTKLEQAGYIVHRVLEKEYKTNKEKTIQLCLAFLL